MVESGKAVKKLGLIINPIAGMGGRVGLKGTDGSHILDKAIKLGAKPLSGFRAKEALACLKKNLNDLILITYNDQMGEAAARECGFSPHVIGFSLTKKTSGEDTRNAARSMLENKIDLLLFAGGDGTARDICSAVGDEVAVLGIPAGVKIHSAVFAQNPSKAGELSALFLMERIKNTRQAEVMDIDEEAYRNGRLEAKLYGYLKIPFGIQHLQRLKAGSVPSEKYTQEAIAHEVVLSMTDEYLYLIGPGTTTKAILNELKLDGSLLGIDIVWKKNLLARDANESEILNHIQNRKSRLIVTPIGGQGYLFGRGNQQISHRVLHKVGKDSIMIIATKHKINELRGRPLLLDTGDRKTDKELSGFYRIITGYNEAIIYRVRA